MSSDTSTTDSTFDGTDKKLWKKLYDDCVRTCRSVLGSDGVKWWKKGGVQTLILKLSQIRPKSIPTWSQNYPKLIPT